MIFQINENKCNMFLVAVTNKLFLCESTVFGVIPGITVNDQLLEDRIVSNLENLQFCTIFSTVSSYLLFDV